MQEAARVLCCGAGVDCTANRARRRPRGLALAPGQLSCPTGQWLCSLGTEQPVTEVTERSLLTAQNRALGGTSPARTHRTWFKVSHPRAEVPMGGLGGGTPRPQHHSASSIHKKGPPPPVVLVLPGGGQGLRRALRAVTLRLDDSLSQPAVSEMAPWSWPGCLMLRYLHVRVGSNCALRH